MTAVNGVATFSGLTLDKAGLGYQIEATGTGLNISAGTSNDFNVTAGSATRLVLFAPPPSAVTAGNAFSLSVAVEDSYGNVVTTDQGSVTLALMTGPAGSVLGGTLTEPEVGGVASFANLTLNKVSTGDTLSLFRNGLTGSSTGSIAVTAGTAEQLAVIQQAPSGIVAGVGFGPGSGRRGRPSATSRRPTARPA